MLNKAVNKLKYDKRDVPLLRGRIHLLSLCFYPLVIRTILKKNIIKELKYALAIFLIGHIFNLITSTLLHNNQLYVYRSAYKRIDIASKLNVYTYDKETAHKYPKGIFILAPGLSIPVAVKYMKNDSFIATIVFIQWILNFMGVFGSLVLDLCCFQKEYRSAFILLINFPDIFLLYKLFESKEYASFMLSFCCLICFISGAVVYCQEKPPILHGLIGHHEIFHILLVIGFGLVVAGNGLVIK